MVRKTVKAGRKIGDIHSSTRRGDKRRWARNFELAKYLNISEMTLWRWKNEPGYDFPAAAKIDSMEFNDLDAVDTWMETRIAERESAR